MAAMIVCGPWPKQTAHPDEVGVAETLPLFPLQTVLFPGMVLPLHIFEPRYRKLFAARAEFDPIFGIVLTRSGREVGDQPEIHSVGTAATLLKAIRHDDGRVDLAVRGTSRFRVRSGDWDESYLTASVEWLPSAVSAESSARAAALAAQARSAFAAYLDALEQTAGQHFEAPTIDADATATAYAVCAMMPFGMAVRQRLLETEPPLQLLHELLAQLRKERELLLATGIGGPAVRHPGRRFSAN
jgi:Lon protease-like protein